jgi:hypothetical protein
MSRIARPRLELQTELREQLALLRHACQAYDGGLEAIAKHISVSLRVLLHHHAKSRALLDQLDLRQGRYADTAGPLSPTNLLAECNLIGGRLDGEDGRYLPLVAMGGGPFPPRLLPFVDWWNEPVLKDNRGSKLCRRELILNVANTDGGGHVDPTLDSAYMNVSRANGLGWTFTDGRMVSAFKGRSELACIRQIAHELLLTLHGRGGELSLHSNPVFPHETN